MKRYTLPQPQGYYVIGDKHTHYLCRPDGTEIWRFDPGSVLHCEIALAALEDHSELLMMAAEERTNLSQGAATKMRLGFMRPLIERLKRQLLPEVDGRRGQSVT